MKKILFIVNNPDFFCSHRLPIAVKAKSEGFDVHVASSQGLGVKEITRLGLAYHEIKFSRSGQNPIKELVTIWQIIILYFRLKPDLVHLITIKPVLYGGVLARLTGVESVVSAVSGLGTVFIAQSNMAVIRLYLVKMLYKMAFKHKNLIVIFQNPSDREVLIKAKALKKNQSALIRGSGVDLTDYICTPEVVGFPVVTMAARLLRDKGVIEFIEAAKILKKNKVSVVMRLVGEPDHGNPTSVTESDLLKWKEEGVVEFLGFREDIAELYAQSHIICLPSYREGLPKSLVEAAACGRAVITTNVPGCRDAIKEGVTGLLVPVKNAVALAEGIQRLIENPSLRMSMARAGRELAEEYFDINIVVKQHFDIYEKLFHSAQA